MALILPLRDALLWILVPILRTRGYSALPVHFLGKAATFNLLYAFPLLLLGDGEGTVATLADVFGWAFAVWGIGLYWWAGVLYAYQVYRFVQTTPRRAAAPDGSSRDRDPLPEHVTTPLLSLITQQALEEDYRSVAERRAREGGARPEPPAVARGGGRGDRGLRHPDQRRRRPELPQRGRSRTPAGRP